MKFDLSEITEIIKNRRTIYPEQFTERVVQKDMIENILNNAIWAPTHGKTQPWRFKVYQGEALQKLGNLCAELYKELTPEDEFREMKFKRLSERMSKTSTVIAVTMVRTPETKIPEIEEIEATACAVQNMLLTATAYGLGSFWSSPKFLYTPTANEKFGYKKEDKILGLIYLGYPATEWPKSHRKPLEYVVEWVNS
jgi:nitroreductase